jgi:hypothetical protein
MRSRLAFRRLVLRLLGLRRGLRREWDGSAVVTRERELRGERLRWREEGKMLGRFLPRVRLGIRAREGYFVEPCVGLVAPVRAV